MSGVDEGDEEAFRREVAAVVQHRANVRKVTVIDVLGDICDPQKQNALVVTSQLPSCPVLPWASGDVQGTSELADLTKLVHRVIQYAQKELLKNLRRQVHAESADVTGQSDAHLRALQRIGIKPPEEDSSDDEGDGELEEESTAQKEDETGDGVAAPEVDDQDDDADAEEAEEEEDEEAAEDDADDDEAATPVELSEEVKQRLATYPDALRQYGADLLEISKKLLSKADAPSTATPLNTGGNKEEEEDEDDPTLVHPVTVSHPFYRINHLQTNGYPTVERWLENLPLVAEKDQFCKEIGYTNHHMAFYCQRGVAKMEFVAQSLTQFLKTYTFSDDEILANLEESLVSFADREADPRMVAEGIFASFLYSAALRDCPDNCPDCETCDARHKEMKAQKKKHQAFHTPARTDAFSWEASLWRVMNQAMRMYPTASQNEVGKRVFAAINLFRPLIAKIDWFVANLPHERRTVFRGINVRVAQRYKVDSIVLWPSFSSTSVEYKVAKRYMEGKGTFFIAHVHSAAMIDFCSQFVHEREVLLMSNRYFKVSNKVSRTVLAMLGCDYDIIQMTEVGAEPSPQEAILGLHEVQQHIAVMYQGYLDRYVEGQVALSQEAPINSMIPLFDMMEDFLSEDTNPANEPLLLLGKGGSGKTSAALACLSKVGAGHLDDDLGKKVIIAFAPLSIVEDIGSVGSVDATIMSILKISEETFSELVDPNGEYILCIVLDSMDEIHLADTSVLHGLLNSARNPLTAQAKVLVSCRPEYLQSHSLPPATVLASDRPTRIRFLQAFNTTNVETFVRLATIQELNAREALKKKRAKSKEKPNPDDEPLSDIDEETDPAKIEQKIADRSAKRYEAITDLQLTRDVLTSPLTLQMAFNVCSTPKLSCTINSADGTSRGELYEAYLTYILNKARSVSTATPATPDEFYKVVLPVALYMLDRQQWKLTVGKVCQILRDVSNVEDPVEWVEYIIPARVEDAHDELSTFEFAHKSIAEFIIARQLFFDAEDTTESIRIPFSITTPLVVGLFSELCISFPNEAVEVVENVLVPQVQESAVDSSPHTVSKASNAMALLAVSGHPIRDYSFAGAIIEKCRLDSAVLDGIDIQGAEFTGCSLRYASFNGASINDAAFRDCVCEIATPPLTGHTEKILSMAVSVDEAYSATGANDGRIVLHHIKSASTYRTLRHDKRPVTALCFNNIGDLLISGHGDGTVVVWNYDLLERAWTTDPKLLKKKVIKAHKSHVVGLYPLGDLRFVSAGFSALNFFSEEDFSRELLFVKRPAEEAPTEEVEEDGDTTAPPAAPEPNKPLPIKMSAITTAESGMSLAVGLETGEIMTYVIDMGPDTPFVPLPHDHTKPIASLKYSSDETLLMSASADTSVRIWALDENGNGTCQLVISETIKMQIRFATFSADEKYALVCPADKSIRVFALADATPVTELEGHSLGVISCYHTSDSKYIVSASFDKTVRLWDGTEFSQKDDLNTHSERITCMDVSVDGTMVVTGSLDTTVRTWDVEGGTQMRRYQGHDTKVHAVRFTLDRQYILSSDEDGLVMKWGVDSGAMEDTFRHHVIQGGETRTKCVVSALLVANETQFVSIERRSKLYIGNISDGSEVKSHVLDYAKTYVKGKNSEASINLAMPSRKRDILAVSHSTFVDIFSFPDLELKHVMKHHNEEVRGISVSPGGGSLLTTGWDGTIAVWHLKDGYKEVPNKSISRVHKDRYIMDGCIFAENEEAGGGLYIMTAGTDKVLTISNPNAKEAKDQIKKRLRGHTNTIISVAVNTTKRVIVTASWDRTVRIWDLDSDKGAGAGACRRTIGSSDRFSANNVVGYLRGGDDNATPLFRFLFRDQGEPSDDAIPKMVFPERQRQKKLKAQMMKKKAAEARKQQQKKMNKQQKQKAAKKQQSKKGGKKGGGGNKKKGGNAVAAAKKKKQQQAQKKKNAGKGKAQAKKPAQKAAKSAPKKAPAKGKGGKAAPKKAPAKKAPAKKKK